MTIIHEGKHPPIDQMRQCEEAADWMRYKEKFKKDYEARKQLKEKTNDRC